MKEKKITKLVIPAAGRGTRMYPASKSVPKEMLRLVDQPVFYYLIKEAALAGITEVFVVIHKEKKYSKATSKKTRNSKKNFPRCLLL